MVTQKQRAFLDMIAFSEGTSTHPLTKNNGYDVVVTGISGPEVFTDYSDHPFAGGRPAKIVKKVPLLTSTAAGRYQVLLRFWRAYQAMLNLTDFSPDSQDAVALRQIKERGAIPMIEAGDVAGAITACSNIWASLPGNDYGQPAHPLEALVEKYGQMLDSQPESA